MSETAARMATDSGVESAIVAALGTRSVVLVGMMGAGKSTVGRRLAARLRLPFLDADLEIEAAHAGLTIPEIFAEHGEPYFRDGEVRVIARLLDGGPCVRLDYDLAVNPGAIRAIHDEVRQVRPGLFLGPAMLKRADAPRLVLWFALDTSVQSAAPLWAPDPS